MNSFRELFERQKRHFASGATRGYAWRVEQLDRMGRLVGENEAALQRAVAQEGRRRSQPAAGSAGGVCPSRRRG